MTQRAVIKKEKSSSRNCFKTNKIFVTILRLKHGAFALLPCFLNVDLGVETDNMNCYPRTTVQLSTPPPRKTVLTVNQATVK